MTTNTAPALGTCIWAGHVIRADAKPTQQFTPCPVCEPVTMNGCTTRSMVKWSKIAARVTKTACDSACTSAKGSKCSCECGGDNHGIAHHRA